jgi:hypothetical protein
MGRKEAIKETTKRTQKEMVGLEKSQRKLDRRIDHLKDILNVKFKIKNSIHNIKNGTLKPDRKEFMIRSKIGGLKNIEAKEIGILKDIEKMAKIINKKYSKIN